MSGNITEAQLNKTLKTSLKEGVFSSAMTGFTQEYFAPFLLLLGGSVRHVGFLSALPNLIASLVQLKGADIVNWLGSRKRTVSIFVSLQSMILLPMVVVALFKEKSPGLFIVLVILFTCCGALANPAWGSLMSDLVSKEKRGQYFGWRQRTLGFVMVGAMFLAGFLLYFMKKIDIFAGFAILFGCAFIWRMISWHFLKQMLELPLRHSADDLFTMYQFLRRLRESKFAKFVIFVSLLNFAVNIASPFFAVLILKELKFNYFLYTVVTLASTLTIFCSIARWGRHADAVGNLKVIQMTALLIGLIPLLWIFNHHPLHLIFVQMFSGFVWAGFNICTSNFIYDAVIPEKRTPCIAYFNTLNGIALCLGAIIGGFSLSALPPLLGYKILTLFLISSLLRITIGLSLPRLLKEVRSVEKIKSDELFFSMIGVRPLIAVERKTIRYL